MDHSHLFHFFCSCWEIHGEVQALGVVGWAKIIRLEGSHKGSPTETFFSYEEHRYLARLRVNVWVWSARVVFTRLVFGPRSGSMLAVVVGVLPCWIVFSAVKTLPLSHSLQADRRPSSQLLPPAPISSFCTRGRRSTPTVRIYLPSCDWEAQEMKTPFQRPPCPLAEEVWFTQRADKAAQVANVKGSIKLKEVCLTSG